MFTAKFFALAVALVAAVDAAPQPQAKMANLGQLAAAQGKYFGTATQSNYFQQSPTFKQIIKQQFTQYTFENEMKWEVIEPTQNNFNYTGTDAIVKLAKANGAILRGHNFCWNSQTPAYVTSITDPLTLKRVLKNHINAVMARYGKDLYAMDVVNEPLNDDATGSYKSNVWYNVLGPDYIDIALTYAHAAAPNVKLYINDYNIEDVNAKSKSLLKIVQGLQAKKVPIHGIGFESHFIGGLFPGDIAQSMKQFTDLGLEVAITELDVRVPASNNITSGNKVGTANSTWLEIQAQNYASAVQACLNSALCPGVTVWGFGDGYSWVPGVFAPQGAADIYDGYFEPKPAFTSIASALKAGPTAH